MSRAAGSTGRNCSRISGATSGRRRARSWTRSRARSPRRSTSSLRPGCTRRARTAAIRASARSAAMAGCRLRGGKFGAFVACSNYPDCKYTQKFGQGGEQAQSDGPTELGDGILLKSGRFGPYVERGEKRASIPKDVPLDDVTTEVAERLLSLPREIGPHPETGQADHGVDRALWALPRARRQICEAELDRRGVRDRHERGGCEACGCRIGRRTARGGGSREPVAVLGKHPANGGEIKVMAGRYGPYVTDGTTNATLPRGAEPKTVTLDEAVRLIDERAAKGPRRKRAAEVRRERKTK